MSNNPEISLISNFVAVDGKKLRTDILRMDSEKMPVSPDDLRSTIVLGRGVINEFIQTTYDRTRKANPTSKIFPPTVWAAQMGTAEQTDGETSQVFTEKGRKNGGIRKDIEEVQRPFYRHWSAIEKAGYMPEAFKISTKADSGGWLLLRKPTILEVAHHWFGHQENTVQQVVREEVQSRDMSTPEARDLSSQNIRLYRVAGEKAIDLYSDSNGDMLRADQQIGLGLAVAALRLYAGDQERYEESVDDAINYADNIPSIHESAILAIRNSVYGTR